MCPRAIYKDISHILSYLVVVLSNNCDDRCLSPYDCLVRVEAGTGSARVSITAGLDRVSSASDLTLHTSVQFLTQTNPPASCHHSINVQSGEEKQCNL